MIELLNSGERKIRRKIAGRWVSIGFLLFVLCIWTGMYFQSRNNSNSLAGPPVSKTAYKNRFEFRDQESKKIMELYVEGKFFTAYCYDEHLKKPILFPVLTASGKTVTRGYPLEPRPFEPTDHPHHYGISLTHGKVNGLDFWSNTDSVPENLKMHYGSVNHHAFEQVKSGNDQGVLEVSCTWNRPDGRVLLDEHTTFIFSAEKDLRIIDRTTTLTAEDLGVQFEDSKEGMYVIRVAHEMEQPSFESRQFLDENGVMKPGPEINNAGVNGLYENSEGITGDSVWGKRARWVMLSSVIEGEPVSLIMFDHPGNPDYPAHWMARGYGLFGINPFGVSDYTKGEESLNYYLEAGHSVTFHYRIAVVNGHKPGREEIEKLDHNFSQ